MGDSYFTIDINHGGRFHDMVKKKRYPKYNGAEMNKDYRFQVGLEFKSIAEFREAIKEHALLNGRDIKYKKNDRVRCRVGCKGRKGKCNWLCFASKVGGADCVRIKTLKGRHTCGRNSDGKLASSSWVAKKIVNHMSRGEDMKLGTVIKCIQDKYMAKISVTKAYWARRKARQEVLGRTGRIKEPDENRPHTKYRRTGTSITCSNCGQYGHNIRHCPNPIVTAPPPVNDAAAAPGSSTPGHGSADLKGGTGRGTVGGMGRERGTGRGAAPQPPPPAPLANQSTIQVAASSQPPPPATKSTTQPAASSRPPTQAALATLATESTPQAAGASQPLPQSTPASHAPHLPSSKPIPATAKTKFKVFGVRRSGRLKLGVIKSQNQPPELVDLTLD